MNIVEKYMEIKGKDSTFLKPNIDILYKKKLKGIVEGVELIRKHMDAGNKILNYTDFDVDGATSAAVIHKSFDIIGYKNIDVLVNKREFGNGFNDMTIDYIKNNPDIKLVISSDQGSSNNYHIGLIRDMGIDVIVTDHHQLKDNTPPENANVFINPQQEEDNTFKCLSGCAVAYLLMTALTEDIYPTDMDRQLEVKNLMELVAISTIGDMMDLSDPVNRAITSEGMKILNTEPSKYIGADGKARNRGSRLGVSFKIRLKTDYIDSKDISFNIVPMLNSCSRVSEAKFAYLTLMGSSVSGGNDSNIEMLLDINNRRKTMQSKLVGIASEQIRNDKKTNVLLLPASGTGINGIVASKISNETYKPTVVFIKGEKVCSGSGRGFIPALNMKECFDHIHSLDNTIFHTENNEVKYGGHAGAAGCSVYLDKIEKFSDMFDSYVSNIKYDIREMLNAKVVNAINITNIKNIDSELRTSIKRLSPFGNGWENPLLLIIPETIKNVKKIALPDGKTMIVKFEVSLEDKPYTFTYFHNVNIDVAIKGCKILCTANIKKNISFNVDTLIPE